MSIREAHELMIRGDWRREHVFGLVELFRTALLTSHADELEDAAAAAATGGAFSAQSRPPEPLLSLSHHTHRRPSSFPRPSPPHPTAPFASHHQSPMNPSRT